MNIEIRIRMCQLLEKMNRSVKYTEILGLTDESSFHGNKRNYKTIVKK